MDALLSPLQGFENLKVATFLVKLRGIRSRGYEDGVDPLLQDHILPAVLKRFDYKQGGMERIETILRRLESPQGRGTFDIYLAQAYEDGVLREFCPNCRW